MDQGLLYKLFRLFVRFWVGFFFKEVTVRNIHLVPSKGPLLIALNHPNNLLDSVLIAAVMPRKIHFLATGQLFRNPLIAALLNSLGAIPVYRQQDGGGELKNQQTFSRVIDVLHAGGVVAIYPEGVTHSDPFLHKIKTGAARMALQAESEANFKAGLKVMPVGMNFLARKSFSRRVMINFGPPMELIDYKTSFQTDERVAVKELTERLQDAIEEQILNIQNAGLQPLIQDIENIYKEYLTDKLLAEGKPERAEDFILSQRIIEAAHFYQRYFPGKFEQLREAILLYKRRLDYIDVPENAFKTELKDGFSTGIFTRILLEGVIGLPVFLYGATQNLLPYFVPRLLGQSSARKETDYATIRFLASIIAFPLLYGLQTLIFVYFFGPLWGSLYLLSLPLSGAYALRYLHGIIYFRHKIHLRNLFTNNRRLLEKLALEREAIISHLNEVRAEYLKATEGSEV
jgi:glycerol-3-phosphate O-acyltransferase / dihydroxyacetone phosphate acyltransferase